MINPDIDEANLEISLSCASSYPCERFDWDIGLYSERLTVSPDAVNLERLNGGASVLKNHDTDKVLGKVLRSWIEDGALCVRIKFRTDNMSRDLFKDIAAGIVQNVSIGYRIDHAAPPYTDENGNRCVDVDKWTPLEVSIAVGVPADPTVGFYRSFALNARKYNNQPRKEETNMEKRADELNPTESAETVDELKARIDELEKENAALKEGNCDEQKEDGDAEKTADESELARSLRKVGEDIVKSINAPHIAAPKRSYNLAAALRGILNGKGGELEREVSNDLYRQCGQEQGSEFSLMVPFNRESMRGIMQTRELADAAATGAGLVAQENLPDLFVDYVRSKIGVKSATFLTGLTGAPVTIPAMTTDTTVAWVYGSTNHTDANTDVSETTPVIGNIELNPHKMGGYTVVGKDLLLMGKPDATGIVMRSLMAKVARLLGTTMLKGNASNPAITGLATATGVQTNVIATIASATWANMLGFAAKVEGLEVDGELEFVMGAADKATFKSIAKGQYGSGFLCEDDRIDGHLVHVDGSLSSGDIFFGDFSNIIVGQWGGIELTLDPFRHARSGMVEVIVQLVCDIAVRRPNTFVKRTAS